MADKLSQIRGLLLDEAERRPSEVEWHKDGRPRADQIAAKMGVSKSLVTRILLGRMNRRAGVLNPRYDDYEPSKALILGIMRWLNMTSREDVWSAIEAARPRPPIRSRLIDRG